ncbi:hypothetical protein HHK36_030848 [Tetracentron sinense]|uniref:Phorbol-ester/DAG-type domain-containing protein n=1 Tax=Tetracentron sinense TaxID=13715 RepID=A0A835CZ36_TETSI|nr:hypothetical protein HHK36_030848 [Tetracentron sinense]
MKYGEMTHPFHPDHKLTYECIQMPFKCNGCNEVGIGSRYKCTSCDFDLHWHCAIPSPTFNHPFYPKCTFQFLTRPPGDKPRYCNACENDVSGFVYHCKLCGFDLHPCCANLPRVLDDGEVKLFLYRKVGASCHKCGRKGRSWSYRSECKKYNLHVACVRKMLVESWHEIYFGRGNSSRRFETKIPSLKGTLACHHGGRKGKVKKCCEMAGLAVQFIISAVLGDPTTLIAGVIGSVMSRS